jgi:hypothetical protein
VRGKKTTFDDVAESELLAARLNEGNVERHTLERLDSFVDGVSGKRLTYARLIA